MPLLRPGLDDRPSPGDLRPALLAARQLLGDGQTIRQVGPIRRFGLGQQRGHLGPQLRLDLARMLVGQRAVTARIGMDLGAIQRHRPQLQHPHLAGQQQHLHEQCFDLREKASTERGDGVVVRMLVRGDEAEGDRVIGRPLQLAAGEHPRGIAVDQNAQQKVWMIGSLTAATIAANHRPQVQAPDHLHHEPRQMPLRQPLVHRRRQQETGVAVDRAEGAHARKIRRAVIIGPRIQSEPSQRVKSDGLLASASARACHRTSSRRPAQ